MREVRTLDGKILHMPDEQQRPIDPFYHCACHERLGNDFFFLPMNSCLQPDRVCTNTKGQRLDG